MLDEDIMRQLRATFKMEAKEHIQAMNRVLLALEDDPPEEERAELMKEIFREAHSLKGSAGAADVPEIEGIAHRLESVFSVAKSGDLELTPDLCDVLYEGIDAAEVIVATTLEGEEHGLDLPTLHRRLDAAEEGRVLTPSAGSGQDGSSDKAAAPQAGKNGGGGDEEPASPHGGPSSGAAEGGARRRGGQGLSHGTEESIRVSTDKLDSLMTQAGELMVAGLKIDQRLKELEAITHATEDWNREWLKIRAAHSQLLHENGDERVRPLLRFLNENERVLKDLAGEVSDLWRGLSRDALLLSRVTSDVSEEVMKVRMLPIATVLNIFPRMVRDLARQKDKEVDLVIEGAETELDRNVLEEIKDPLVHLVRNAVDHGIEKPDEREASGKPRVGTVTVKAYQKGSNIVVEVGDDGAGIDVEEVKRAALKSKVLPQEELEAISDEQAMQLIFASGVSTSKMITETSGRGVGMDVVRKNVEALHGHVDVDSTLGEGTITTLTLPLTLATTQELLVRVRDQTFGIPISAVERIQRIEPESISTVEGKEAIIVNGQPISLVYLCDVLEMPKQERALDPKEKIPVVILGAGRWRIAFLVDAVVGQQESVVKSLGKQLSRVRNVAGATILGTGQVIMTLNPSDLLKSARGAAGKTDIAARIARSQEEEEKRTTVLVVDDALATRNLEKNILETVGYDVKVAADGVEALSILQSDGGCDVVISDVVMPNMDGFELTAAVREDAKLADTPIILVTSLESTEDKERGLEVGADAYIVKSSFEQETLLDAVRQLA
jgi:two-component system chemotaxis sensor kinase CheA